MMSNQYSGITYSKIGNWMLVLIFENAQMLCHFDIKAAARESSMFGIKR